MEGIKNMEIIHDFRNICKRAEGRIRVDGSVQIQVCLAPIFHAKDEIYNVSPEW